MVVFLLYTVSHKRETLNLCPYLRHIWTDFHNYFTSTFSMKFAIKWLSNIPPHHEYVATLPCEILVPKNYCIIEKYSYMLILCRFVWGQRTGDWPLTLKSIEEMCPWFFAFGQTNYARWTPVFLKDMARLPQIHPTVHEALMEGKFVVQRGARSSPWWHLIRAMSTV